MLAAYSVSGISDEPEFAAVEINTVK